MSQWVDLSHDAQIYIESTLTSHTVEHIHMLEITIKILWPQELTPLYLKRQVRYTAYVRMWQSLRNRESFKYFKIDVF